MIEDHYYMVLAIMAALMDGTSYNLVSNPKSRIQLGSKTFKRVYSVKQVRKKRERNMTLS